MRFVTGAAVFVVALAASLVVRAPAALLEGTLASALPPGAATGPLEGTVWNGRTASVSYRGVALGALAWHVNGIGLFPPGANVALTLDGANLRVTGNVGAAMGSSRVALDAVTARLLPGELAAAFGFHLAKPTGAVRLDIDNAVIDAAAAQVETATGEVEWSDAGISEPTPVSLGNAKLAVTPRPNGGLTGTINSSGGDIGLDGTVSLGPSGTYQANVAITPRPGLSSDVTSVIGLIAPADAAGVNRLRASGNLRGGLVLQPSS